MVWPLTRSTWMTGQWSEGWERWRNRLEHKGSEHWTAAADWVSHCDHWRTVDSSRLVTPNILWQTLRPQRGLVRAGTCDAAQFWHLSIEARPEQPDNGLVRWLGLSLSLPAAMAGCEASVHSTTLHHCSAPLPAPLYRTQLAFILVTKSRGSCRGKLSCYLYFKLGSYLLT